MRACARARAGARTGASTTEAQIYTFLPAAGGVGVTTLAIADRDAAAQGARTGGRPSTCLVDLDFQHGACCDYLDLEPRLDLDEIEPRPERLDRQLLEVMLSHHASGLQVIAAPSRPAEMRAFDLEVVTRLLDLVVVALRPCRDRRAAHLVRLDRQRPDRLEPAVPRDRDDGAGAAHATHLVTVIRERLADGPQPR